MAVAMMQEFLIGDRSTANYDFMKEKLAGEQIEGLLAHTAGFDDENGVWRMLDVWESREHADRFMERMVHMVTPESLPRPDTAIMQPIRQSYYELHDFVKN
jgi:hypothetical protein